MAELPPVSIVVMGRNEAANLPDEQVLKGQR